MASPTPVDCSAPPGRQPNSQTQPEIFLPYVITHDSYALNLGMTFRRIITQLKDDHSGATRTQFAEHVARAFHTLIFIPSTEFGLEKPTARRTTRATS